MAERLLQGAYSTNLFYPNCRSRKEEPKPQGKGTARRTSLSQQKK